MSTSADCTQGGNARTLRRRTAAVTTALIAAAAIASSNAQAAPALRVQVTQRGDFALIGNTLEQEFRNGTPSPIVGDLGSCKALLILNETEDSGGDCLWRSNDANDNANSSLLIDVPEARSVAVLSLPAGATVTHAYLYWGAHKGGSADTTATITRPGGLSLSVNAASSYTNSASNAYQSVADITSFVKTNGNGAYRVSGVTMSDPRSLASDEQDFAGWYMIVLYEDATANMRNLAVFDGLDRVSQGNSQNVTISGFNVPAAGFDAKLGIVSWESESILTGDSMFVNDFMNPLTDPQNPATNFFNGTRSFLGAAKTVVGDLPQLTGGPGSYTGFDLDVVDITNRLKQGDTSANIRATSSGDVYLLGGFVTGITTFIPDFSTSNKTGVDLNGGGLLPGDVIEYTIHVANTGNDTSIDTYVEDEIPLGATFVPGSIQIVNGPGAGAKTDALADDQGEYDALSEKVVVRVGTNANGTTGGTLAVGESTDVKFRITVNSGISSSIENTAFIHASGMLGAPPAQTPTDGDPVTPGSQPTDNPVDGCVGNGDCSPAAPICDMTKVPPACVECVTSADCGSTSPLCVANNCECTTDPECGGPMSGMVCHDQIKECIEGCRGMDGNGCPIGEHCTSMDTSIGTCVPDGSGGAGGSGSGSMSTSSMGTASTSSMGTASTSSMGSASGGSASTSSESTSSMGSASGGAGGGKSGGAFAQGNGIFCSAAAGSSADWIVALAMAGGLGALAVRRSKKRR